MDRYPALRSAFGWSLPDRFNFSADVVDRWAEGPDRLALLWCGRKGEERRYSFAQISEMSGRMAAALQAQGVGKGDRVMVMLPRIPEWQIAMVAVLRIGAVAVPCIPMLTDRDIAYRCAHSGAVAAIATTADVKKFADCASILTGIAVGGACDDNARWLDWSRVLDSTKVACAAAEVAAEDPAVIYYTSGSTGTPKGVTHAARALFAWRESARDWLDLGPDDLIHCPADTGWSKAGTSVLFGPWSCAASVLFHEAPFDPETRLSLLERYRVTVYCAAATELRQMVTLNFSAAALGALRLTVSAGESVNPEIVQKWTRMTGRPLLEAYGLTETLMVVANYLDSPVRPGAMGRPRPGVDVAVIDDNGRQAAIGEIGELAIRLPNPQMMLGYWNDPERTAAAICNLDGPIIS